MCVYVSTRLRKGTDVSMYVPARVAGGAGGAGAAGGAGGAGAAPAAGAAGAAATSVCGLRRLVYEVLTSI